MLSSFLVNALEEVCVCPVLCADGVGTQNEVQAEGGVTQTTQQFLVAGVFDLRALLKPYDGNTVDGLQLGRFVHTLEDDLAAVGELDNHGRGSVLNLLLATATQLQVLKYLNQQIEA